MAPTPQHRPCSDVLGSPRRPGLVGIGTGSALLGMKIPKDGAAEVHGTQRMWDLGG